MDDQQEAEGMAALNEAIEACGGISALAKRIGVAPSLPGMWKHRKRVPADYCPAIYRETGVQCERLRPDVPWDALRRRPRRGSSKEAAHG